MGHLLRPAKIPRLHLVPQLLQVPSHVLDLASVLHVLLRPGSSRHLVVGQILMHSKRALVEGLEVLLLRI